MPSLATCCFAPDRGERHGARRVIYEKGGEEGEGEERGEGGGEKEGEKRRRNETVSI